MFSEKWDKRFLRLAKFIVDDQWSKDPSTKVGSCIIRPDKTVASLGFNGLPKNMSDIDEYLSNREEKYPRIIHAEMNAILNAKEQLDGYCLYCYPLSPCDRCAVHIIQKGIKRVVVPGNFYNDRWLDSNNKAIQYFKECGVEYLALDI